MTEANISLPDEAREVIFPHGVPVTMLNLPPDAGAFAERPQKPTEQVEAKSMRADKEQANSAEGNLENTSDKIQQQAAASEKQDAENLID